MFNYILLLLVMLMTAADRYHMLKGKVMPPTPLWWKDIFLYSGLITFICCLPLLTMPDLSVFQYLPSVLAIGDVLLGLFLKIHESRKN